MLAGYIAGDGYFHLKGSRMRFHVIALPHTQTSKTHNLCAYTMKVLNFCKMMKTRGHTVFHYGAENSDVVCDEHIEIISRKEQEQFFGKYNLGDFYPIEWDAKKPYWQLTNARVILGISQRVQQGDFICVSAGGAIYKPIQQFFNQTGVAFTVETGIGYEGTFADFRVFESQAVMHLVYGAQKGFNCDGGNYDVVIPNYFDLEDFPYDPHAIKGDYYLYLGRLIGRKGINVAVETCKRLNKKLIIAGQGMKEATRHRIVTTAGEVFEGCEMGYVGIADVKKRAELYAGAIATFVPTIYVEPFGGVAVESQLCGTPVITSDFGAFPETVIHGKTGFRCRTLDHCIFAAKEAQHLNRQFIRDYAASNYSIERIALMYEEYFSMLTDMWKKGWYEEHPERTQLNWLKRYTSGLDWPVNPDPILYDEGFHKRIEDEESVQASSIAEWLDAKYKPASVIDFGCSTGTYLLPWKWKDKNVVGYENSEPAVEHRLLEEVILQDITRVFTKDERCELSICLEVLEHISEKHENTVIDNICVNTYDHGTILFSAAVPGQGGDGHINCRPKEYWLKKFDQHGWAPDCLATEQLITHVRRWAHLGWFVNNVVIFRKKAL
jgi:glycosyltransferase involved in cell wall biosynthesis